MSAAASITGTASSSSSASQKVVSKGVLRGKDAGSKWKVAGRIVRMGVKFEGIRAELENETERTRLLKEVTRSAVTQRAVRRFDSQDYLKKRRITLETEQDPFDSPRVGKAHGRHKHSKSRESRAPAQREIFEATVCAELENGTNLSQLLISSGKEIDERKQLLKADEGRAARQRQRNADWSWPQNDEVHIAAEGVNVPKMSEASRGEASTVKYVQHSVDFEELDALEELIQHSDGYDGLRSAFERRFEYHPRMKLLNDFVLKDPEALRTALVGDISIENTLSEKKRPDSPTTSKTLMKSTKSQSMSAAMFSKQGLTSSLSPARRNSRTGSMKRGKSYVF